MGTMLGQGEAARATGGSQRVCFDTLPGGSPVLVTPARAGRIQFGRGPKLFPSQLRICEQLVQKTGDVGVVRRLFAVAAVRPGARRPVGAVVRSGMTPDFRHECYGLVPRSAMNSRAMRRALSRMERTAASLVIVARDTPSMSSPTVSGASTLLPRNCSMNSGRSIEK